MATRRQVLSSGVLFAIPGLAGCWDVNSGGTTDISVSNETAAAVTARIRVTRLETETRLLDETVTLDAAETDAFEEVVSGATVAVSVRVRGGRADTYEWSDGDSDAEGLAIDIAADSITFSPFVR